MFNPWNYIYEMYSPNFVPSLSGLGQQFCRLQDFQSWEALADRTYHCCHSLRRTAALLAACPDLTLLFRDRNCILGWGRPGAGWEHKQKKNKTKKNREWKAWKSVFGHFILPGFVKSLQTYYPFKQNDKSSVWFNDTAATIWTWSSRNEKQSWLFTG